ncbi:AMGO1 protein, partial [Aegotheles bennettii]|nr:AMGO1 protein [Aegotheles bennettii]
SCPQRCVCASNILSCSQALLGAVPAPLPRFTAVLDLSHNNLSRLRADWAPGRLPHLHALLLGHNGLSFVSTEAFAHVPHLRHLDLSSNRLRALEENLFSDLPELEVLLLYNNEIATVDRAAFENLPRLRKLYLGHNRIARFPLELLRDGTRLPQLALLDLSANRLRARVAEEGGNGSAALLANGSLQLRALRPEDAGTYACWVGGPVLNETLYVELLVHNFTLHGPHDTLNTAYTTLVGCILSVVLVLIYLYLTPCRCCCCRGAEKPPAPRDDSINSSVLSATPNHAAGVPGEPCGSRSATISTGSGQNGRFKAGGTPQPPPRHGPRAQRKVSDPDSVSSVFSDTPIVV